MLNRIIKFSLENKLIIGLFTLTLIFYGSYQFTKLPIDAVPDITNNQVQVITVAPSFGAVDIERFVTFPIEQANSNLPGLIEMRSFSRFGLSLVTIVFDDDTDVYFARQQVSERLRKVQSEIPAGIGIPELGPVSTGLGEIYQYVVRAAPGYEKKYDAIELRSIQDWIVRRQLLGVQGVAEVSSFGGKLKEYAIEIDPNKLKSHNISIVDVFDALEKNNQNVGGAYIEKGPTVLYIRTEGLIGTKEDIENISIKSTALGTPLFIRDVAEIVIGYAPRYGAMCYNDEGEVAGAIVMMLKGANSNKVINDVKERIAQIRKTLPEGVIIEPFLDRSKMVNNAINTVKVNLMEGALIVIFVLVMFLGNVRAGLVVASVIPLSMLFAIIMMNLFGVSGNLMSLGALDFGLIVDGAVIVVEAVMFNLHHAKKFVSVNRLSQPQMDTEVQQAAGRMMNVAVFGQIIILVVYLPILTLQGIEGKMFKPMAQTVAFALIGAFILSLTYVPMISSLILSKKLSHKPSLSDRVMNTIGLYYRKMLNKVVDYPKAVITTVLIFFAFSVWVLSRLGGEFIPSLEEGDFAVDTRVLTGSNLNTTIEYTQKAAHVLLTKFPEVEKVVTKIGSGEVPTDPMPMEASDMMVILKPKKEWTSAKTFDELSEKMGKALEDVPGISAGFQYPVQMRFNELMTGARQDVVCKIFGEDLDTLSHYAHQLGALIQKIDGAKDVYVETVSGMPQIIIDYNRDAIARYNLNIEEVNRVVNTAFAGQSTGLLFEGEKRFNVVVRLKGEIKTGLSAVQQLLITTPSGTQVPLHHLAKVSIEDGPNQIQREDAKRRIVVGFNVRGRDVQSIVDELQQKIDADVNFPPGYYITFGGSFENLKAATQRLLIAVPISLLLIFLLLYFTFRSIKLGLLIYSAIPLSAIGGILFLAWRGMPFSISAGVGFIALFGVSVLNGIVLIAAFNRLKLEGMNNLKEIVLKGTATRLRPVLMTAFVASLGFLPMALSTGAGAEVQRPLATVVIGGLMIATFLTLFVLPILYMMFEKIKIKKEKIGVATVLLILCCSINNVQAQQPIRLNEAIDSALKNNLQVKNQKLIAAYHQSRIASSKEIATTDFSAEVGQINSAYNEMKLGVAQSFRFPGVFKHDKQYLQATSKSAGLDVVMKEGELKMQVTKVYYEIVQLKEQQKVWLYMDSIYSAFYDRAVARLKMGESDVLEKLTAETQLGQIKNKLRMIQQENSKLQIAFQFLLNAETTFVPVMDQIVLPVPLKNEAVNQHPLINRLKQDIAVANAVLPVERAKLLPDFTIGYFNNGFRGTGADDKVYSASDRFHSIQFGVGVPVFTKFQKAKIKSAKILQQVAEGDLNAKEQELEMKYEQLLRQHAQLSDELRYYQDTALKNATLMRNSANAKLLNGSINYLDWVQLFQLSLNIQFEYLSTIEALNATAIQLTYITLKN